jgi:tetratricopeptide (TPR) repeat protein
VASKMLQTREQYQQDEGWQLYPLEILAELAYLSGDNEEGERLLHQYKRVYEQNTTRQALLPGPYAAREEWSQALSDLREQVRRTEPFPSPAAIAYLAELTVLAGEPLAEQEAACTRAVALAEQSGTRKFLALALRARGRMSGEQQRWDEAEQDLRRALEMFQALDLPYSQGETLYCLGQLQQLQAALLPAEQSTAKQGLAHLFYEQALGFFQSLHALRAAQRVRTALAEGTQTPV